MNKIIISFIPHKEQRYDTLGDYFYNENGDLEIKVSDSGNEYINRLVAIHEFVEESVAKKRGITEQEILNFDLQYEQEDHNDTDEPGCDPRSPYLKEHSFAECLERLLCNEYNINWKEYEEKLYNL